LPGAPFVDAFVSARAALEGDDQTSPLHFLRYAQLSPTAERVLKAAGRAWVFGAMGSWNDLVVDPEIGPRYEAASKGLFTAVQRAVLTVANSTYHG
jgi:hypothetical protein